MGISGLLPVLKSITETKELSAYRGQTLAIDGYCWLHRGIYSCSQEICLGQETDKYITYFMDRIQALIQNGITPYVVFDGGPLPMKKGTEEERRAARAKNRELGVKCFKQGNYAEARKYFARAADVSPYMAHRVIQRLKRMNVQYVVAPYEADAQLTYLIQQDLVDGVITEDSDCLPFGCHTVLFKLDRDGVAQEIQTANLKINKGLSFHMFSDQMFLEMCVFSGCDYLPSLAGFGLKKAYTAVKQHGTFTKIIRALRLEGKVRIPTTYEDDFERALLTFRHQTVYDPRSQQLVPLTPIPDEVRAKLPSMDFVGPMLANDVAIAITEGDMDPITSIRFSAAGEQQQNPSKESAVSFIQRRPTPASTDTATPVIQKKPDPAASNNFRHLPSSFMRKPTPLPAFAPPAPIGAKRIPSPAKRISRFFASSVEQSSQSETDDLSLSATSFESQEAVNVTTSVTFSPLEDAAKHKQRGEKENQAPSSKRSQENAFARMMRAGSLLQKQSLKRKAIGGTAFHGRKAQMVSKKYTSPLELIQQHAYKTERPNMSHYSSGIKESTESIEPDEPEVENCSSNQEQEEESKPLAQPVTLPLQMSTRTSTRSSIASLDRFRFNK